MKKLLIGVVTFLFVAGMVQAEPVKRVDGKRVETYKRITVDTVRGDSTNGIRYDTNRDGADEITMSAAGNLIFEGSTADDFETTVGVVDPTTPDKTINFPDASGTVAVSASAPATLSVLGDIGVTVAGDLVTTAPITGAANDIFIGADGTKATIGITVLKDIVAAGTGMSGGEDDVLPGADADVTITLTTAKDIVAGTGLTGGEDNVLPGADADTTLSLDLAAANIWTGAHSFQSASPQLTLGKDETGGTPNIVGGIKVFSAGDNAYYSTLTAGTNTSNAAFTLPVDEPAGTYLLNMTTGGQIGYDASTYLTSSTGALVSLSNLASVAINTSLLPASANSVDFGSEALYGRKAYLASDISFEGATDNDYQTTLTAVDPTVADKSINIPNANGTIAVSATSPMAVSVLGDLSIAQATTSVDGYVVQADWDSWTDHVADNTQAHSDYFLNSGADTAGAGAGFAWTFDASAGADPTLTFGDGTVAVAGTLSATALSGDLTGDVTGNVSGSSGSCTGNSATATILETTRAIYGNNFDGSAPLTGIIASTYGGTGNGFTAFTGPTTAERVFTLPDATSTLLYSGGALGTPSGGTLTNCTGLPYTGLANGTDGNLITWAADATIAVVATGDAGQVLTSGGVGVAPTFQAAAAETLAATLAAGADANDVNITSGADIALDSLSSDGATIVIGLGDENTYTQTGGTTHAFTLGSSAGDDFTIDGTGFVYEGDTKSVGIGGPDIPKGSLNVFRSASDVNPVLLVEHVSNLTSSSYRDGLIVGEEGWDIGDMVLSLWTDGTNDVAYIEAARLSSYYIVPLVLQANGGNVGIGVTDPDQKLEVAGRIKMTTWTADGDTAAYRDTATDSIALVASDRRLKKNITPLTSALDIVKQLETYKYNDLDEEDTKKKRLGLMGGEVLEIIPELTFEIIRTTVDEVTGENIEKIYYGVHYDKLPVLLLGAIKEQQAEIEILKLRIDKLEKKNAN